MQKMTDAEYRAFLSDGTRTLKVATVRADGRPHLAPVWFILDGEHIIFMTGQTSAKGVNLCRDPRVSLCVDDDTPPFVFVLIEGTVTLSEETDDLIHWATRIAERYMGAENAEAYGKRNGVPGELLVRVTPTKVIAQTGIAD